MTSLRLSLLALPLALTALAPATHAQQKPQPDCIRSWGEARARALGYDHVVVIENGCDKRATCTITTDVAPAPIQATVEPKKKIELTTFRGSPATTFKPKVDCKLP